MEKAGVSMPPEKFAYEVSRAYSALDTGLSEPAVVPSRLRSCHSYPVFQESLRQAGRPRSALVLGCGEGLCGQTATYAKTELERIWPDAPAVDTLELTPPVLWDSSRWPRRRYDVVVTHSMVHFVYDLGLLFQLIDGALTPNGAYVMGKEENARWWRNGDLQAHAAKRRVRYQRRSRWTRYFSLYNWHQFAGRMLGIPPVDVYQGVNRILARRLGAKTPLTPEEISRLIEVHRPREAPGGMQIGMCGFDTAHLQAKYLPDFRLQWFGTSGWLGYAPQEHLSRQERETAIQFGRRYPEDGVYFSACWRKASTQW
jgi:hypothetical protein